MKKTNYLALLLLLVLSLSFANASDDDMEMTTTSSTMLSDDLDNSDDDMDEDESMDDSEDELEDDSEDEDESMDDSAIKHHMIFMSGSVDGRMYKNINIKDIRKEKREVISSNFEALKENRSIIKNEFSLRSELKWLNSELQKEIKVINDTFKEESKLLEDEIKSNKWDLEKIQEIRDELNELRVSYYEELISIVDNTEVKESLTSRLELLKENIALIDSNMEARVEFRWKLNDKVTKYKDVLETKLEKGLPKIKEDKLENVLSKIDKVTEVIENNTKISQTKKDQILSQIIALKELLEEELESKNLDSSVTITE